MEIAGYEDYLIYEDGGVYSKKSKIFLKPSDCRGYLQISLCKNGKKKTLKIHRLVALHYIPNPENKPHIDHIDRDPSNNNIDNLRWVTCLENHQNKGDFKNNTSGVKNVSIRDRGNYLDYTYKKTINKITHTKYFENFEDACIYKKECELTIS
tara:strand:- start:411 stop:869 length:459 start_codon:yes stop_codon:yes gene_type:complete